MGHEQLSLLSEKHTVNDKGKKPRPGNIPSPVSEKFKNTQVYYSAFGWEFQIVAAIVLSLKYRKSLKSVKVEGKTEDIELYLENEAPIFAQAKATTQKMDEFNDEKKPCIGALETLLNTSNSQRNGYSKLIYINNFLNPLKLSKEVRAYSWQPTANEVLIKEYSALPKEGQLFLKERLNDAKRELGKHYLNSTRNFDWNRFEIITLIMDNNDKNNKFNILNKVIEEILVGINYESYYKSLTSSFTEQYLDNATKKSQTIRKEDILWQFIYKIVEVMNDSYLESIDITIQNDVEIYSKKFIAEQVLNIDIINKVYYDYGMFKAQTSLIPKEALRKFLDEEWKKLKEYFPMSTEDDVEIQKNCIQDIIWRILTKQRIVNKLKREFGLYNEDKFNEISF